MRILCLTDFPIRPDDRWLWDCVPGNQDQVDFLYAPVSDRYSGWSRALVYYPRLTRLGWRALEKAERGQYDLIVAWEGKNGFPLALLRRLTGSQFPPLAILTFSIRGPLKHFVALQKYGVRGADHFSVPTQAERLSYAKGLGIPLERIRHLPLGMHDVFGGQFGKEPGDYIFTGGRSGRDYLTFLRAVAGLELPVVLNARPFNLRHLTIPPNVHLHDIQPLNVYRDQNWVARFVVIPLTAVDEAVGLTAILSAMAAGKAVISTALPGPAEYVVPGETGWLVPVGDAAALRQAIQSLWDQPELCTQMGKKARQLYAEQYTFTKFAFRVDQYLHEIISI